MSFDPAVFENQVLDQANETQFTPIPEGRYGDAFVDNYKLRSVDTKNGPALQLQIFWHLTNQPELESKLNRDKVLARQDVWLDVTPDGKGLAYGPNQNVTLGLVREALKMNKPGKPFSFPMLVGAGPATVHITHQHDKNDTNKIYSNVSKVEPLGKGQ